VKANETSHALVTVKCFSGTVGTFGTVYFARDGADCTYFTIITFK